MPLLRKAFEALMLVFFVSHVPITIFVDSQALFPREWYPRWAVTMLDNFIADYKDPLMTPPLKPWFKALVVSEVYLQLPFFVFGVYAIINRINCRIPFIIYGSFVVATMFPILGELAAHEHSGYNSAKVIAFYLPYAIIPALLVGVLALSPEAFPSSAVAKTKRN